MNRLGLALVLSACLMAGCAGQPSDLKCSLVPCHLTPPENFTAKQQGAWLECMKRTHERRPLSVGPVAITTMPKEQRDYDACVTEAQAVKQ
jgi:hypothetical protein